MSIGPNSRQRRRIVVVGSGALARSTIDDLTLRRDVVLLGNLPLDGETPHPAIDVPVLASAASLAPLLESTYVDVVYLAADPLRHREALQQAVDTCERLGVPFALPVSTLRLQRAQLAAADLAPDGFVQFQPYAPAIGQRRLKRSLDVLGAALGLLALAPLFAAVAVAVKLESRGPVFFRQSRVGRHGRPFGMFKFRSMVVDAEARRAALEAQNEHKRGPVFKITHDPRITRVGRWIRRTSIDELPQLWNVLRGEMSLVGPRPPIPAEVQKYDAWQRRRLSVTPGLTGLWQVSGRNNVDFDEWMRLDLRYIDTWSFALDLRLLGRTIPVVLTGKGAS
jgi:exopolysaccharide biosynthesis polyprenyl glycosylphosphotransferase